MADRHNGDEQPIILNSIDDAIVADTQTQMAFLAALKRLDSVRPRILGQGIDLFADSFTKIAWERLDGPQGRGDDRDGVLRHAQGSES